MKVRGRVHRRNDATGIAKSVRGSTSWYQCYRSRSSQGPISSHFPSSHDFKVRMLSKVLPESNIAHHRVNGVDSASPGGRRAGPLLALSTPPFQSHNAQDSYLEELRPRLAFSPIHQGLNPSTSKLVRFFGHQRPCQFRQRALCSNHSHRPRFRTHPIRCRRTYFHSPYRHYRCQPHYSQARRPQHTLAPGCWYSKDTVYRYPAPPDFDVWVNTVSCNNPAC